MSRDRSNPAFQSAALSSRYGLAAPGAATMTIAGTAGKTFVLLLVTIAAAVYTWLQIAPAQIGSAVTIAVLSGFAVALVTIFRPALARWTAPLYAVLEGVALGGLSAMLDAVPKYKGIPMQATVLTFAVFALMLGLYSARVIRATERVKAVIINATLAVAVYYLIDLLLSFAGVRLPFMAIDHSVAGFAVNLVIAGIAAFNLILDFDFVERAAQGRLAKDVEWYGAFSLLVTLVWLWIEIVRLLMRRK